MLVVVAHGVHDLLAHPDDWIQGVHRALSDQRDRRQPQPSHLLLPDGEEVHTIQLDAAALDLARRADQPHQRECDGRFA